MIQVKDINSALNTCKTLVLNDMSGDSSCLITKWTDFTTYPSKTEPTNVTPEQHLNNIIDWCKHNINNKTWSYRNTSHVTPTSYGLKHRCERDLKCYVANNWMKLAMILADIEVAKMDYNYKNEKWYICPVMFSDIVTNSENFIYRKPTKEINKNEMFNEFSYDLIYSPSGYSKNNFIRDIQYICK